MMRATLCIALAASASGLVLPGPMRPAGVTSTAARTSADPEMSLLTKLTDLLFPDSKSGTSTTAVSRLKVVLANDRTGVDEQTMQKIRAEIQEVVKKYLAIDEDGVNFDVMTDERLTLLTASFPIVGGTKRLRTLQMDVATNDG
mmetsp:Transcript_19668/g.63999  ORF Transcript_19668/g.63999 Transcript_19668/m.63999 type:complete len:144 (+) Transcript_19668:57-488(+)